jgi:hypothetical protein
LGCRARRNRARALVRKHWRAVAILALRIHERGTVTGAEARAIIEANMVRVEEEREAMARGG